MPFLDDYISSSEAAKMLGVHRYSIQRLMWDGRLPAQKIANRWLVARAAVEELAENYVPRVGRPRTKRKYTKRSPKWFSN